MTPYAAAHADGCERCTALVRVRVLSRAAVAVGYALALMVAARWAFEALGL